MIISSKHQLLITLILACACVPVFCQEPNQPKPELKFEISGRSRQWRTAGGGPGRGSIKPTHVAALFVSDYISYYEYLLQTSAGQSMSELQRNFLAATKDAIVHIGSSGDTVRGFSRLCLYAVSEDDAKKMAQALIEASTNRANARLQHAITQRKQLQESISEAKKQIPEKEAEAKNAKVKLDELKKTIYYRSEKEAEETIVEMNKMLNHLDIELVGMKVKLRAIREHQDRQQAIRNQKLEEGINREGILLKLEEMQIDLLIELKVAEARKNTAIKIRNQAQEWYDLTNSYWMAKGKKEELSETLAEHEARLSRWDEPKLEMFLPKVYENKVTIYPVRVDE